MKRNLINSMAVALCLALVPSTGAAQGGKNIQLHVNPRWKQCSFQLDPSLTQGAWRRFTQEAGLVGYFRPLADAQPMGRGKFEVSAVQWETGIDDASSAWNDTFVHPNATHWLYEGSGLTFPGFTARAGINDRIDVGAYLTKNVEANYGFFGGQLQYNLRNAAEQHWAASTRVSFVSLFGPEDLNFSVYGVDLLASRSYTLRPRWLSVSPYAGVSGYLSRSHEKSAAVTLRDESVTGMQAMVGVAAAVSRLRLGVEYNTARVQSTAVKVGVSF